MKQTILLFFIAVLLLNSRNYAQVNYIKKLDSTITNIKDASKAYTYNSVYAVVKNIGLNTNSFYLFNTTTTTDSIELFVEFQLFANKAAFDSSKQPLSIINLRKRLPNTGWPSETLIKNKIYTILKEQ